MLPGVANAGKTATAVPLVNDGGVLNPTQRVASTSYVQGAYNTLGTQINNLVTDTTVTGNNETYTAIATGNSVAENLIALDGAIRAAAGDSSDTYVTKESAVARSPIENGTLNYLGETSAGTNVGLNLGILDSKIKSNENALTLLNGNAETAGSVAYAVAAENARAVAAESGLSERIGTLNTDGRYVSVDSSVASNLVSLDAQVESNTLHIGQLSSLSQSGNLNTPDSRATLVSAINTLDAAIADAGTASNVANGHYIGTYNNKHSVAENLTALDNQVYTNAQNIGDDVATMGTTAETVSGAVKEMHSQTINVSTTWGNDEVTAKVNLFPQKTE